MKIAKMNPPPNMPGANAELNSHSMITINALLQLSLLSVNTRIRTIYAQSRITTDTIARKNQKVEFLVQFTARKAAISKSFRKSQTVTPKPINTGHIIRFGEKCLSSSLGSVCILFRWGLSFRCCFRSTDHEIIESISHKYK